MEKNCERNGTGKTGHRYRYVRVLAAMLCLCLMITTCPYMPGESSLHAAEAEQRSADNREHHTDHVSWTALSSNDTGLSGGNYYLSGDMEMGTITITGDVTLCLNGYTLRHDSTKGSVILVESGTFTLCDCKDEHTYSWNGSKENPEYTLEGSGGCITGGTGSGVDVFGGGIYVSSGAVFNMESGVIRENQANVGTSNADHSYLGGGVYSAGTFNLSGGFIVNNAAHFGGGVYIETSSSFKISGNAVIMNNQTSHGGAGVYTYGSSITIEGGKILGNTAGAFGAGVMLHTGDIFNMTDGLIEGNTSTATTGLGGGGLYIPQGKTSTLNVSGGCIRYNRTYTNGGGVRLLAPNEPSMLNLSGTIAIYDNYGSDGSANNLYVQKASSINITGPLSNPIGITSQKKPGSAEPVVIANGNGYDITDSDWRCFSSDDETYEILKKITDTGNELLLCMVVNCDLGGLALSTEGAALTPEFDKDTTYYTSTVTNSVETIGITATLGESAAENAKISIKNNDGTESEMTSGEEKMTDLKVGSNTIEITVASGDVSKTYTLVITRESAPILTGTVTIDGEVSVGKTLTAVTQDIPEGAVLKYQWYYVGASDAQNEDIEGATGSTYTPGADDAGKKLGVKVTADGYDGQIEVKTETIQAAEHSMKKTEAKEPTCTEAGNKEYWTCLVCHKLYEDEQGNTETDSSKVIVPAAGHIFPAQWTVEKEATEKEPGRQHKTCEKCGTKIYQTIEPTGTPSDPYTGKLEKKVEVLPGAPDTVLNNSKQELAQSVLTAEEIAEISSGADAKIWLEISPNVEINEEDKEQIQKAAENSAGAGAEVTYFDVSLFKQVGEGEKTKVHEPDKPVSITIVIPEKIRNKDVLMVRNYQIIRLHDGKIDIIEGTYNEESAKFTFETDKFSVYAICYNDSPKQAGLGTPTPTSAPDETGQTGNEIEKRKDLSILLAAGKQKGGTGIKLTWLKWKGASGYEVYWSYCDGKKNFRKRKTVKATAKRTYTHKKLKKNRAYKYYIAAYKMVDGKKKYVAKSPIIHVAMKYEGRTNAKKITSNKAKAVLSLTNEKYKKTCKLKVKVKKENSRKKLITHAAELRYYTDDKKIVKVSRKGKITAIGRGTCTVYVIANNGVYKKITVTVK